MERAISGLPRRCEADAWEEEQRGLYRARMRAFGQSREERSGLRNLLRCDEAEGNPACAMIKKQKRGFARGNDFRNKGNDDPLASLLGVPKKKTKYFWGVRLRGRCRTNVRRKEFCRAAERRFFKEAVWSSN